MHILFYVVVFILAVLFVASIVIRHVYLENLKPLNDSQASHLITIPTGYSLRQIADLLKKEGIIRSSWAFEWYVRNDSTAIDNLEAGTYNLRSNQPVSQIVLLLTEGRAVNGVTILPGQRLDQIKQALVGDGFNLTEINAALNPNLYKKNYPMLAGLPDGATLEGFLYPDSFQKNSQTNVGTIINESLSEMQTHLNSQIVNSFGKQGLSVYQGVTLASIVEQEVSNTKDKPIVAEVFLSRLKNGMPLGSDVTSLYGSILYGQSPPSISADTPYNTRLHAGLPPGPISNVSEESLLAVANPASTNYLYFVTGDNGTTYYSQTLDQHNQQVQLYCHTLCSGAQ